MEIYDIIYSIGRDCAAASYLNKHLLRKTSGPLDWNAIPSFAGRVDFITSHFENFLNEEDLVPFEKIEGSPNDKACDAYENKRTGFYFPHDFPAGVPLKEALPDVKAKYARRINRFYENIRNNERVLLVYLSHFPEMEPGLDSMVEDAETLCRFFGKNIDFLFILHDPTMKKGETHYEFINNHIHVYKLYTRASSPLQFRGIEKYIDPIFRKFGLPDTRRRRLRRRLGRFFAAFIPFRSLRKKVRARFE